MFIHAKVGQGFVVKLFFKLSYFVLLIDFFNAQATPSFEQYRTKCGLVRCKFSSRSLPSVA